MATLTEERFRALEAEVARLRAKVEGPREDVAESLSTERTSPDFLQTMVGIHADSPAFEEVTRTLEAEREQEREEARRLLAEDESGR